MEILKPEAQEPNKPVVTHPERTEEFLEEISLTGDPAMVAEMIKDQTAKASDIGSDLRMILPKGNFQAEGFDPNPHIEEIRLLKGNFQAGGGEPYSRPPRNKIERLKAYFDEREAPFTDPNKPLPQLMSTTELAIGLEAYMKNNLEPKLKEQERLRRLDRNSPDSNRLWKAGVPVKI